MIANFFQLLQPGLDALDMRFADAPEIRPLHHGFFFPPRLPHLRCRAVQPSCLERLLPVCGQRSAASLKHTY